MSQEIPDLDRHYTYKVQTPEGDLIGKLLFYGPADAEGSYYDHVIGISSEIPLEEGAVEEPGVRHILVDPRVGGLAQELISQVGFPVAEKDIPPSKKIKSIRMAALVLNLTCDEQGVPLPIVVDERDPTNITATLNASLFEGTQTIRLKPTIPSLIPLPKGNVRPDKEVDFSDAAVVVSWLGQTLEVSAELIHYRIYDRDDELKIVVQSEGTLKIPEQKILNVLIEEMAESRIRNRGAYHLTQSEISSRIFRGTIDNKTFKKDIELPMIALQKKLDFAIRWGHTGSSSSDEIRYALHENTFGKKIPS